VLRLFLLALGLAVTSCQAIADIEAHEADPLPKVCELPKHTAGTGSGRVRLAHVFPSTQNVDICVRSTGGSYKRPTFRSSGIDKNTICGKGLEYASATAPFSVPTGSLDFRVIPAGQPCSAPALAEKTGVDVGTEVIVTLVYAGPAEGPATLQPMLESISGIAQNRQTRLVNTMAGRPLVWGVGKDNALPTILASPILNAPLGFLQLATQGMANTGFTVDKDGYGYVEFAPLDLSYGAADPVAGEPRPKMLLLGPLTGAGFFTLYAIGGTRDFPARGLYCRDREDDGQGLQICKRTEIEAFKVDIFNAGLYGAFAVLEDLRANKVIEDLAARGTVSDLLCVSEVARHDELDLPDKQRSYTEEALVRAASSVPGGFQYFAQSKSDLDTPITEPENQQGEVPDPTVSPPRPIDPPARAACDASVDQAVVDEAYKCLIDNCNTEPGRETGITLGGVKCFADKCGAIALAPLIFGNAFAQQCFNCIAMNGVSYVPWAKSKELCKKTETRRPYAWGGRSTAVLLSKYKLSNIEQYVLPSTAFRRVAVYAKMEYEAGKEPLDVYCIHAPPLLGSLMPYTGGYANGASGAAAWQEENIWGIRKVIGWIQRKSEGRPAIIMGDWSGSAMSRDKDGNIILGRDGRPMIGDVTPDGILALQQTFFEAVSDDWKTQCDIANPSAICKPQCTRCPKKDLADPGRLGNTYNTIEDPIWNLRVFVKDPWVTNPAQSAEIFYNEPDRVRFPEVTEFGLAGPLADTYGFRVNLKRP